MTREEAIILFSICLDINGLQERKKRTTGNLPTVFFDFSGHTATVDVRIYLSGWELGADADKKFTLYLNKDMGDAFEDVYVYLVDLKKKMTA